MDKPQSRWSAHGWTGVYGTKPYYNDAEKLELKLNDVTGDTWTLSDFWDDGAGGGRVSVGLAVVMLLVDIVMYSIITWYIDSINPGPYGKRKPFTFIFKVTSLFRLKCKNVVITIFNNFLHLVF